MLKKHFMILYVIACLLLIGMLSVPTVEAGNLQMYTVSNTTGARVKTQISEDYIEPGREIILGYELVPFGASCVDPYVELHDAAATGDQTQTTGGTLFSANELDTSPLRADVRMFPKPKHLSLGLSVNLGGYTAVIIYYERRI